MSRRRFYLNVGYLNVGTGVGEYPPDAAFEARASRFGVLMSCDPVNPVSAYPMSSAMNTMIFGHDSALFLR